MRPAPEPRQNHLLAALPAEVQTRRFPDRTRLQTLSCECYAVVKRETGRRLPCLPQRGPD